MPPKCQHPDGCDRPVKGHGWCRPHLDRVRSTGAPGPAAIAPRQSLSRECSVSDCPSEVGRDGARDMCGTHYQRWLKHGDTETVDVGGASLALEANPHWSGEDATYNAVHCRLRSVRGRAREFACVDCAGPARHWSYDNSGIAEKASPEGWRYSTDLSTYVPRCVRCHKRADRAILTGERP